ncbi:MAG: hypothetical protein U9P12_09085, partial [Verrucomicrobiota bacterium]|nr:hypothetical protein [Verrucomicrobiota bacterium]
MRAKKIAGLLLSVFVLAGVARATIVYQDDFSGAATNNAKASVPEVSMSGFLPVSASTGLDGSGRLESTNPGGSGANYRFRIATDRLTDNPAIGEIKYTVTMRTPTNDWVMIGFHENNANGLLSGTINGGPIVQFNPTSVILRGGTWGGGAVSSTFQSAYALSSVITAEMTYHVGAGTMDLAINGSTITNGFALEHEFPTGTLSDPVVYWAQMQLRLQPSAADGGTYIDSFQIETTPAVAGTTIYQDDFSGAATNVATTTVPEISPVGFEQRYFTTGLDGNGHLESTNPAQSGAGYRVKLGTDPLTDDTSIEAIRLTIHMRTPTNDWVMIGLQEGGANGLLTAANNAGPILQFNPTSVQLRGGTWGGGTVTPGLYNFYSAGDEIVAEMTYHVDTQTMDLSIDSLVVTNGFVLNHEFPVGTPSDPVVYWLNSQLRFQPSAADGGAYIDSWQVEILPEVADSGYAGWAAGWGTDIGAETNDYDGDGLLNVYEYGLGGDPTNALDQGTSPESAIMNDGGTNWFGYVHPQLAVDQNSGLSYYLELNTDLVAGTWTNAGY